MDCLEALILDNRFDVNSTTESGRSLLGTAIISGRQAAVDMLLRCRGLSLHYEDELGDNVFDLCETLHRTDLLKRLHSHRTLQDQKVTG